MWKLGVDCYKNRRGRRVAPRPRRGGADSLYPSSSDAGPRASRIARRQTSLMDAYALFTAGSNERIIYYFIRARIIDTALSGSCNIQEPSGVQPSPSGARRDIGRGQWRRAGITRKQRGRAELNHYALWGVTLVMEKTTTSYMYRREDEGERPFSARPALSAISCSLRAKRTPLNKECECFHRSARSKETT
ncbi:unnamed protein product [Leptosia nina]|uniref:Uncharacterized protein n=1 Tax=Leptosia nina TaxID=320188 RepID=A0AAV1JFE1_9NEOP